MTLSPPLSSPSYYKIFEESGSLGTPWTEPVPEKRSNGSLEGAVDFSGETLLQRRVATREISRFIESNRKATCNMDAQATMRHSSRTFPPHRKRCHTAKLLELSQARRARAQTCAIAEDARPSLARWCESRPNRYRQVILDAAQRRMFSHEAKHNLYE